MEETKKLDLRMKKTVEDYFQSQPRQEEEMPRQNTPQSPRGETRDSDLGPRTPFEDEGIENTPPN